MVTRLSRKVAKAGDNTRSDPPDNNRDHTESGLFGNGSGRGRNVNKMMQLDTVENCMADADVREVHAERLLLLLGLVS